METLYDLTQQESGIVVYEDKAIIVCNWANSCPTGGLPRLAPWGQDLIAWPTKINAIKEYQVDDIRDALPGSLIDAGEEDGQNLIEAHGMDIVYDYNSDIPSLWGYDIGLGSDINRDEAGNLRPTQGTIYELEDGTLIIAPDGWC